MYKAASGEYEKTKLPADIPPVTFFAVPRNVEQGICNEPGLNVKQCVFAFDQIYIYIERYKRYIRYFELKLHLHIVGTS